MAVPDPRSDRLERLFPDGVVAVEAAGEGDPAGLTPAEALAVARGVPKRVREFAAGRHAARAALRHLGLVPGELLPRPDRTPAWPGGIVGSLSHTVGFCAAVAGRAERFLGLGFDVEVVGRVTGELHERILTAGERRQLAAVAPDRRDRLATLVFSAKEAFYKSQYPATGEWLEFADIELDGTWWKDPAATEGGFLVRPTRALRLELPAPWAGRFSCFDGLVATGVALQIR